MARTGLAAGRKKAVAEQQTIVFMDETGVRLLPSVVRTYAPRGQTPVLSAAGINSTESAE
jgi:hypothetical protein